MSGHLSIRGFLAAMAATAVLGAVAVLCLPHSSYIRYQSFQDTIFERLDWVYERLAFDETPIDILVVGSSRSGRGVDSAALSEALKARGIDAHVANISIPAAGFDTRLTKIREALGHHQVKLVIWGLAEVFPRDGHQTFGQLGRTTEVLGSPPIINRTLPANLAQLPYRQMEYWLATRVPEAFGYQRGFDPETYEGPTPDLRLFNNPDLNIAEELVEVRTEAHARMLAEESAGRRAGIRPAVLPDSLGWAEFGVSRHYVHELLDLSEENGFQVGFLFLPFYLGYPAPAEAAWLSERGPLWSADFLLNDPQNYVDAAHVSQIGADQVIPWLADRIAPLMTE